MSESGQPLYKHCQIINVDVMCIYWPAGENIFANMLFGSFINVALQHTKEWNSMLQTYVNFLIILFVESFIHP